MGAPLFFLHSTVTEWAAGQSIPTFPLFPVFLPPPLVVRGDAGWESERPFFSSPGVCYNPITWSASGGLLSPAKFPQPISPT